jgi:hypothetical protein
MLGPDWSVGVLYYSELPKVAALQLEQEFVGNALFAPSYVLLYHASHELAYVLGKRWPAAARLPAHTI